MQAALQEAANRKKKSKKRGDRGLDRWSQEEAFKCCKIYLRVIEQILNVSLGYKIYWDGWLTFKLFLQLDYVVISGKLLIC